MMRWCVCIFLFTLFTPSFATADEERPVKLAAATAIIYPFSLTDKTGAPPASLTAVTLIVPFSQRWNLLFRTGFASPFTLFQPAPQVQLGVNRKMSDALILATNIVYRYVPAWNGTPGEAHIAAWMVTPLFPITSGVILGFPVGLARNITFKKTLLITSFELNFILPT